MRKFISAKLAGNLLLGIYVLPAIFHVLVLAQVVPSDIGWGGQIGNSQTNLVTLETIALTVTGLFAVVVADNIRTWFFGSAGCGRIFASLIASNHRWEA